MSGNFQQAPSPGWVRIRPTAIGLHAGRDSSQGGRCPAASARPVGAAGRVELLGDSCGELAQGQRVAYLTLASVGAACVDVPCSSVVALPEVVCDETAAAVLVKGLMAYTLLLQLRPVLAGECVLFQAVAGGVGLLFCQLARHFGVRVIGTASSEEKRQLAERNGCTVALPYTRNTVLERVVRMTGGRGVNMAFDAVGDRTLALSLDSLAERGQLVSYGNSSGAVPRYTRHCLAERSLSICAPHVLTYHRGDALGRHAAQLMEWVGSGVLKPHVGGRWPHKEMAAAQQQWRARRTAGQLLLIPD